MASQTGYNDAGDFGEGHPPTLRSIDLPSKRLLGKGLASIGYETEWEGVTFARKDFMGVPSLIFYNEAGALVRLKDVHQNVVKTIGLTIDKLSCSLVLEYMDDKLTDLLQKRKDQRKWSPAGTHIGKESENFPFELQEALDLILQIASGMEYLHEQGILHGDLKTRNILVSYVENGDKNLSVKAVKVADFGLIQTKRNSMSHVSPNVRKLDTARWKAPELLRGASPSSESDSSSDDDSIRSSGITLRKLRSADVYSFAVTCSQILTGEEPYPKRNWKELVAGIVSNEVRPKLPPDPSFPKLLSKLLVSCWDTDPDKRPTFSNIRKELEQLNKDYSSFKRMELVKPNPPIPEFFDADSSKVAHPAPDYGELLSIGKAVVFEHTEPIENNPSVPTHREEDIHDDNIMMVSGPSLNRSDDIQIFLDRFATSGATDDQTQLELRRSRKRLRGQYSSSVMDVEYDVYLNYRAPDVMAGFVAHLEDALTTAGLNPFQVLKAKGHDVFMSKDNALEVAKVHVVVISRGYAESIFCLNELVAILKSGKPVIPVFYDVGPSHLHHVESGPFAAAFENHKSRQTQEQVENWADALRNLAKISGFEMADRHWNEAEVKRKVVDAVLTFTKPKKPKKTLLHDLHLVGTEQHMNLCLKKLKMSGNSGATCLLGLVGMGGVGKTLLAKEIYNHFVGHEKFQAMSFLEMDCVSPSSMEVGQGLIRRLQKQLLLDLLSITMDESESSFKDCFHNLSNQGPMLIVFDAIYDKSQFDQLIFDTSLLPPGSYIIATSRDQHLLKLIAGKLNFYLHEIIPLGCDDSEKLFNWHAFGNEEAPEDFKALAKNISNACGGLPLALKLVGSSLFGKTSNEDRESVWLEAVEVLRVDKKTSTLLKWSYDNLSEPEKLMFIDIAFVLYGQIKKEALEIWKSCSECSACHSSMMPLTSLRCLIEKSLVVLECLKGDEILAMHILLKSMAEDIGNANGSHLKDKRAINAILANKFQEASKVRALNFENVEQRLIDTTILAKMTNLHFLVLNGCHVNGNFENISSELRWLQWRCIPMTYLPPMPNLFNLVSLDISMSIKLIDVESTFQDCPNLLRLYMNWCTSITKLPDSIGCLLRLKTLDLHGCGELQELPSSIGQLTSLELLNLQGCGSLKALPDTIIALTRLQCFQIGGCSSLLKLPQGIGSLMAGLTSLSINLVTKEQAADVTQTNALKHLTVMECTDEAITTVDSSEALKKMDQLKELNFSSSKAITKLPNTVGLLTKLDKLCLFNCDNLKELPNSIGLLRVLRTLDLRACSNLTALPESLGGLASLEFLSIVQCATFTNLPLLKEEGDNPLQLLPDSLGQLNALQYLQILDCGNLEDLGVLPVLQSLHIWHISIPKLPGSCLIVLNSEFWDPSWYYDIAEYSMVVRRDLKEVAVVEESDFGFLRVVVDDQMGRRIVQRVYTSYYELAMLDV